MLYPFLKRGFDVVMSGLGLILLLPLGLVLAGLVKFTDGGSVFFTQIRIGRYARPFPIRKFRSMIVDADKVGLSVTPEGDPRITRIGRFLRKTKLDELPQLWNVFIGEMSFVGPRPEVPRYVAGYTSDQREILQHRPGITDMATLKFRNEEALLRGCADVDAFYRRYCIPKKIALNRQYLANPSLTQDFWVIVQTLCPYWLGVLGVYSLVLVFSFGFAYLLKFDFRLPEQAVPGWGYAVVVAVVPQLLLLLWKGRVRGMFSFFGLAEMRRIVEVLGSAALLTVILELVLESHWTPSIGLTLIHCLVSLVAIGGIRVTFRFLRERSMKHPSIKDRASGKATECRVGIVGTSAWAIHLALDVNRNSETGRRVVAFFDDNPLSWNTRPHDIPVVGMPECLLNREWQEGLDEVIVALPDEVVTRAREIEELLRGLRWKVSRLPSRPQF